MAWELIDKLCKEHGIRFTQYIDDLTFSSEQDFRDQIDHLISVVKEVGFRISHPKTKYNSRAEVTGILTSSHTISPKASLVAKKKEPNKGRALYFERVKKVSKTPRKKVIPIK